MNKDSWLLILVAIGMAALAWGFWHVAGGEGSNIITTIALIVLLVDNLRLRKELRTKERQQS